MSKNENFSFYSSKRNNKWEFQLKIKHKVKGDQRWILEISLDCLYNDKKLGAHYQHKSRFDI